jgi:hypothetical protein
MSDDEKTVPESNEVRRDHGEVQYHEIDETNVGETDRPREPNADEAQRRERGE